MTAGIAETLIAPGALDPDLDHILAHTRDLWEQVRGQRILLSGGTGFFGCWLLESFAWANDHLNLGASATVLSRNPAAFASKSPHLARHPAIRLHEGDIRSFEFPAGEFGVVIHAAGEVNQQAAAADPRLTIETAVEGTRRILEFARQRGAKKLLLTSSGAVYGQQPPGITHIPESYPGAPDPLEPRSAYGVSKRRAELLCAFYAERHGLACKIARCFAFAGPYLPAGGHFAFGSFLRDAMEGRPIRVSGDGTPRRSYLYAADLAIWLWTILFRGETGRPYNVGSECDMSIAELANEISRILNPGLAVEIARQAVPGQLPQWYVPSTRRAQSELGLRETTGLREAILRTARWHRPTAIPISA